ncbi:hypothetical protein FSW04_02270 [Baekduia soli]|uniref:Membrane-anchored protein n=1 Tax=Baekduia soli TaxID=496014 RepID=A0A5B8U0L4_9ACTN|nr:hypothetical protein [Baekduia soli]QEC46518.1 hypothetical protein FSW04_02270 [Baekduia soli]
MLPTAKTRSGRPAPLAAKVPEITAVFWALKILTTGMGESMSDFLGQQSVPLAGAIGIFGLTYAIRLQVRTTEYRAVVYWFAVMMVAIFGTMAADGLKDGAGLSYAVTTPFFAAVVAVVFVLWHRSEGTLDIHSITTARRETYYWIAVLATFALGTAAGDLTALTLHLGFLESIAIFGVLFLVPALGWWQLRLNPVVAFWTAYVITRPLGASVVDWLAKPQSNKGLDLGDGVVSAGTLVVFVALVAWVAVTRRDIQRPDVPQPHAHLPHVPHPHLPHGHPQAQPAEG